eukprot:25540_1
MKAKDSDLHYDIIEGTPISVPHLMGLILYCNFSDLSTAFSKTFRKKNKTETLESVKNRNGNYWHLSKHLREVVEIYGSDGTNKSIKNISGPFFSGVSSEMVLPEFNIRLCSPISTSTYLEVATRFGGDQGMIIQLNNHMDSERLRSFDCSWISCFKEEDEQLFIGGEWRIRVESVLLVKGWKNYKKLFKVLFYFDAMMSAPKSMAIKTRKQYYLKYNGKSNNFSMISSLIEYELYGNGNSNIPDQFDEYILNTFHIFCQNKK